MSVTYTVHDADTGKDYDIKVPDGTSEDDALKSFLSKRRTTASWGEPEESFWERTKGGLAHAPINAYLGVKDLFGGLSDEEKTIARLNDEAREKAPVGSGLLGDAALWAIPGLKAYKWVKKGLEATKLLKPKGFMSSQYLANPISGGLLGGVEGTLQPGENQAKFGATVGTVAGTVLPPLGKGLFQLGRTGYRAGIEPWMNPVHIKGRAYLDAAGDRVQALQDALFARKQLVPGSFPDAGQAGAKASRSEWNAFMRSAGRVNPTPAGGLVDAQNRARVKAIETVSKDRTTLNTAIKQRADDAALNYGEAFDDVLDVDRTLIRLMKRPSISQVMKRAQNIAEEQGRTFKFKLDAEKTPDLGKPLRGTFKVTPRTKKISVEDAHYMKIAMDDIKGDPASFGISASEAQAIGETQKLFIKWVEKGSASYANARTTYADQSRTINRMQVGQHIKDVTKPPTYQEGAGGQKLDEKGFVRTISRAEAVESGTVVAKRAADVIQKRATGKARYKDIGEILTKDETAAIDGVRKDFLRSMRDVSLAESGAQAGPNAIDVVTQSLEETAGGGKLRMLDRMAFIWNQMVARLTGKVNKKIAAQIAVERLFPEQAGQSLKQAAKRRAQIDKIANAVMSIGVVSRAVATAQSTNKKAEFARSQ